MKTLRGDAPRRIRTFASRFGWVAVVVAWVGGLTLMACQAAVRVRSVVVINVPGLGAIRFEVDIDSNGRGDFQNDTSSCQLVTFTDGDNNVLGTGKAKPGNNPGLAPPGTKKAQGTPIPCDTGDDDLVDGGPGMRKIGWNHLHTYPVFGAPLVFDEQNMDNNAVYSFLVRALTVEEAHNIAAMTIAQPIGTPIDPRVTVLSYFKPRINGTSLDVVALARDRFTVFRMDFNGVVDYATLGDGAHQRQLGPELWIVEAPIAAADINGYDQWNDVFLRTRNLGRNEVQSRLAMIHDD